MVGRRIIRDSRRGPGGGSIRPSWRRTRRRMPSAPMTSCARRRCGFSARRPKSTRRRTRSSVSVAATSWPTPAAGRRASARCSIARAVAPMRSRPSARRCTRAAATMKRRPAARRRDARRGVSRPSSSAVRRPRPRTAPPTDRRAGLRAHQAPPRDHAPAQTPTRRRAGEIDLVATPTHPQALAPQRRDHRLTSRPPRQQPRPHAPATPAPLARAHGRRPNYATTSMDARSWARSVAGLRAGTTTPRCGCSGAGRHAASARATAFRSGRWPPLTRAATASRATTPTAMRARRPSPRARRRAPRRARRCRR
jgi:hypothetical protein